MRKWTRTAGLLFLASASVYANQVFGGKPGNQANPPGRTGVTVLEENLDPFVQTVADEAVVESAPTPKPVGAMHSHEDGTFSLNIVNGADLVEQLRVIGFQAQRSIIPSRDVRGTLPAMDLYNVTINEALDALLHPNGFEWRERGAMIYVYTKREIEEQERAARTRATEVFRLYHSSAATALALVRPALSSDAIIATSTAAASGLSNFDGGNSHASDDLLVITDYPDKLDAVRRLLAEVDRRPQQVMIEATIVTAKLQENNSLGVDFNILSGVNFTDIITNSGQVQRGVTPSPSPLDNRAAGGGTGSNFTQGVNGGLKIGFVSSNVSVFLAALEGVTDTVVLANPKILAVNKQLGRVSVGRRLPYRERTVQETAATESVKFLETGTVLTFRPYISGDGFIRMEINPKDSIGFLNAEGLPVEDSTEATTNIIVRDGHTVVIGGLFRESTTRGRSQVPFLGNLPLAGALFRQQDDRTEREEVIILLTPHIIKDDDAFARMSEKELRHAEQLRVGVRRGLMWTGRERLAQLNYELAVEAMNQPVPNRKKALWHLNAATNLVPTYSEAIELRQELTGRELAAADGSSIRHFVRRQVMAEKDLPPAVPVPRSVRITPDPAATTQPAIPPATEPPAESSNLQQTDPPATQPTGPVVSGSGRGFTLAWLLDSIRQVFVPQTFFRRDPEIGQTPVIVSIPTSESMK